MPNISGTVGNDSLNGTQADDLINGNDGDDLIVDAWGDDVIDGGNGDDEIVDEGGNNVIRGGAGNDRITISDIYPAQSSTIGDQIRVNSVDAGDGNDFVTIGRLPGGALTVDLGAGDDILRITRPIDAAHSLRLGSGRDQVLLTYEFGDFLRSSFAVLTIADFSAGASGDVLDLGEALRGYFSSPSVLAAFAGGNPFANGIVVLVQDGADTLVQVDYDGSKSDLIEPRTIVRLENVSVAALTAENFGGFNLAGGLPTQVTVDGTAGDDVLVAPAAGGIVNAGNGADDILGGFRADFIDGGIGNDSIDGGAGNDTLRGGDGNDLITDGWGDDLIEGGAGDDRILIFRPGIAGVDTPIAETVTINGGDGNDYVRFEIGRADGAPIDHRTATLITDLGAGNDTIEIAADFNRAVPDAHITLGAGRDQLILRALPQNPVVVTDFAAGNSGDILHLSQAILIAQGWNLVTNPFAAGYLQLQQSGADTLVLFDYDGSGGGSGNGFTFTLLRLIGVQATSLTAANFNGFAPDGSASSFFVATGTAGNDVLTGAYGAQTIEGGAGDDRIDELFGGSDILRGGDGNDVIRVVGGFAPAPVSLTISGDAGNDLIDFSVNESSGQTQSATIDLGTGDDRIILRALPSGGTRLTLGAGRDVIEVNIVLASQSLGSFVITDFATGASGDLFDWNLFAASEAIDGDPDLEPFVSGVARLVQSGNDTVLQIADRPESDLFNIVATFANTLATSFTVENLGFDPNHATLSGTTAGETLNGTGARDIIAGRDGDDRINGLDGDDRLYGEIGADIISGGEGNDYIRGGTGNDRLSGDNGNDLIFGGLGSDTIFGGGGDDDITDIDGADIIEGGTGNDIISVALGFDISVVGGVAAGRVVAGDGNDVVTITNAFFGTNNSMVAATYSVDLGAGDDRLITDGHFGFITLGAGRDTLQFTAGVDSYGSVITDFVTGANGDVIDLSGLLGFSADVAANSVRNLLQLGNNPFALGVFELEQRGSDVVMILHPSVAGIFSDQLVMTFQNTVLANFTAENFSGFNPHATPVIPTFLTADTIIAAGQSLAIANSVPDALTLDAASSHFVYNAGGNVDFTNNGSILTTANQVGYSTPVGISVSRFSSPDQDAWFHNSATGRFTVRGDFDDGTGLVSAFGQRSYGFYGPQQSLHFRNDGYFEVTSLAGSAVGVFTGFDVTTTRQFINTGTILVDGGYSALGILLGFSASFENSGSISAISLVDSVAVRWNQYSGGTFINSGSILALNSAQSPFLSVGVELFETFSTGVERPRVIENRGRITADIAIVTYDTSPPAPLSEHVINSGIIEGAILLGAGDDQVINRSGGQIDGVVILEGGDDLYDGRGGIQTGGVLGGLGNDTYRVDSQTTVLIEEAGEGNDTVEATVTYSLATLSEIENLTLIGDAAIDATGSVGVNILTGNTAANRLTGGLGNDMLNGGGNVDTAVVSGNRSAYAITQTSTGVFSLVGADGTDTLTGIEYVQFADILLRLLPGNGVSVNFNTADPSVYQSALNGLRDFDGNALGGDGSWLRIGSADVNGDGDVDQIIVNRSIGRFATVGTAGDGLVYFADHGWAGETRVAGIYIDPLVQSGQVVAGSANDSQRRFQNDLAIENINRVLGAGDYDRDGLQEVYFALNDGTAYLHAYMHADGNIQYANYQSQQQVIDFLTANGFPPSTWATWFPAGAEEVSKQGDESVAVPQDLPDNLAGGHGREISADPADDPIGLFADFDPLVQPQYPILSVDSFRLIEIFA